VGHRWRKLGRRQRILPGAHAQGSGDRVIRENGQRVAAKGRGSRIAGCRAFESFRNSKEVRMRKGIIWIVLALLVSTLALAQAKKQLDINTASEDEMIAIGIEKAAAKKIVEARPYRNKTELVSRQLLSKVQYDKLKDSLVAKRVMDTKPLKPVGKPVGSPVGK
jgi:hypothetical protein